MKKGSRGFLVKRMKTKFLLLLLLLTFLPTYGSAEEEDVPPVLTSAIELPEDIRVLKKIRILLHKGESAEIYAAPTLNIYDGYNGSFVASFDERSLRLNKIGQDIEINGQRFQKRLLVFVSQDHDYGFKDRKYSGRFIIFNETDGIYIINEVPLESYIRGVVPSEIFSNWPLEALKAQAVASRTYAVFSVLRNLGLVYHVSDSVSSQVYLGMQNFNPRTDRAVTETRGEILINQNAVFPAFFHSTSGGHTSPAHTVWDIEPHPSLAGVFTRFSWSSPHQNWKETFQLKEIELKLSERGYLRGELLHILPGLSDGLGRISEFTLVTSEGNQKILANDFRLVLGAEKMKSAFVVITEDDGMIQMEGKGWGHGVGLCQWSAKGMSDLGYRYHEILEHFYPESELVKMDL